MDSRSSGTVPTGIANFGQHHLFVFKVRLRARSGGRRSGSGPEGPDTPKGGPLRVGREGWEAQHFAFFFPSPATIFAALENTTKIPREETQEREERANLWAVRGRAVRRTGGPEEGGGLWGVRVIPTLAKH